jgi:hypothetical protein
LPNTNQERFEAFTGFFAPEFFELSFEPVLSFAAAPVLASLPVDGWVVDVVDSDAPDSVDEPDSAVEPEPARLVDFPLFLLSLT